MILESEEQFPKIAIPEGGCHMIPEDLGPYHCLHGLSTREQCCCWCGDVFLPSNEARIHGDNFHPLSPREVDVVKHLADGCSNDEIGDRLGISPHTVKFHIKHVMMKIDSSNRAAIVAYAFRRGIIS